LCEHLSHVDESPCNPKLKACAKQKEILFMSGTTNWRTTVQKSERKYSGINKLGLIIPIDARLAESLDRVQAEGFLADGEITDSRFYIWDLLSVNDTDLRVQPYESLKKAASLRCGF
jgi:hypothetical protein